MHVTAQFQKITVRFHYNGLKTPLIKVPRSSVSAVEVGRVGYIEMPHEFREICFGGLNDQVEMVGHEDVGVQPDLINFQGSLEFLQKCSTVGIVAEDFSSFIATAGNVVKGVWVVNPKRSCHAPSDITRGSPKSNIKI
jgi:hypothetical protein